MQKSLKFDWVDKDVEDFLIPSYIQNQTVEERYVDIAKRFEEISGIEGWAQKWVEYFSKAWTTMSSPIISNLGKNTGLPASCNMLDIQDTLESIAYGEAEMMLLAKNGAGTARNFSKVRAKGQPYGTGGQSVGVMSWIRHYANKIYDTSQGGMRKGFFTAGLSADHPEIMDFLTIGREGSDIKRITTYVTIPQGWMESILQGDEKKYEIFVEIHESRAEKGYPYILFEDNANKGKSEIYKDKWLTNTNICSECLEYTDEFKEFLCVLLSVNLEKWDEWKNTDFIFDCNLALDCVITEYIDKAKNITGLEKSVRFAEEHRAIGIGAMGWHSLLMKESIVYGSMEAHMLNNQIFSYIRKESDKASKWMAKEWGEPKMLVGTGYRNTSRMALAPTKSTSNLVKVTEGGQIIEANYNTLDLARSQTENKNKHLIPVLQKYNKDDEETWNSILEFAGSVQHLDFLSQHEKDVFKISTEVGQLDHIKMFASRAKYFDQSMSMNLTIPSTADAEEVMSLTIEAWLSGLKTMYYQHNTNMAREATKSLLTCTSCEA